MMKPRLALASSILSLELVLRIGGHALSSQALGKSPDRTEMQKGAYRILTVGQSTTAPMHGQDKSWPHQLELILAAWHPSQRFVVINKGISGTNTAFILARMRRRKRFSP